MSPSTLPSTPSSISSIATSPATLLSAFAAPLLMLLFAPCSPSSSRRHPTAAESVAKRSKTFAPLSVRAQHQKRILRRGGPPAKSTPHKHKAHGRTRNRTPRRRPTNRSPYSLHQVICLVKAIQLFLVLIYQCLTNTWDAGFPYVAVSSLSRTWPLDVRLPGPQLQQTPPSSNS